MCAWERFVFLQIFNTFRRNYFRIQPVNIEMLEFNLGDMFFFDVDDSLRLPVFSWWDNSANNPGDEVAWFTFFFFGVVLFDKDGAIVMGNSNDDDDGNGGGNDNYDNNGDDDDNTDNAVFERFVIAASLDLPNLTFFVGVTIEGDGLYLLGVLASDGVWLFFFLP